MFFFGPLFLLGEPLALVFFVANAFFFGCLLTLQKIALFYSDHGKMLLGVRKARFKLLHMVELDAKGTAVEEIDQASTKLLTPGEKGQGAPASFLLFSWKKNEDNWTADLQAAVSTEETLPGGRESRLGAELSLDTKQQPVTIAARSPGARTPLGVERRLSDAEVGKSKFRHSVSMGKAPRVVSKTAARRVGSMRHGTSQETTAVEKTKTRARRTSSSVDGDGTPPIARTKSFSKSDANLNDSPPTSPSKPNTASPEDLAQQDADSTQEPTSPKKAKATESGDSNDSSDSS
jgi:hypothetical protein